MFDILSTAKLQTLLDLFSIPMFALDRISDTEPFHIVCMNGALETLSQQPRSAILGRSIYELLPHDEAQEASRNYIKCASTGNDVRFSEVFTDNGDRYQWDTTLQSVRTTEGHDRIVGTTMRMERHLPRLSDQYALEEVKYYSTIADLHLQNMTTMCDLLADCSSENMSAEDDLRSAQLMAVCRSVQRAVDDVRHTVRQAQARHTTPPVVIQRESPEQQPAANTAFKNVACGTVSALVAIACPGSARMN